MTVERRHIAALCLAVDSLTAAVAELVDGMYPGLGPEDLPRAMQSAKQRIAAAHDIIHLIQTDPAAVPELHEALVADAEAPEEAPDAD